MKHIISSYLQSEPGVVVNGSNNAFPESTTRKVMYNKPTNSVRGAILDFS